MTRTENFFVAQTAERGSATRSSLVGLKAPRVRLGVSMFDTAAAHRAALRGSLRGGAGRSERGIALIITLILLSVITFMAVTFLVVSRSEHGSVATTTDQAAARYAVETAQAVATARVLAPILALTNEFNYGLMVSTNWQNPNGFVIGGTSLTNVNYYYNTPGGLGGPLLGNDLAQNIANLFYDPRVPVYVTNQLARTNEFRFYYDINRNGRYDMNGSAPVISSDPANPYYNTNGVPITGIIPGNTLSNFMVGDPEWIGVLERPDFPHSSSNRFVSRYAYLVAPAGNTLDVNYMHNYSPARGGRQNMQSDCFLRNEGVGTWEENLAAFLVDLNYNYWPTNTYQYQFSTNGTLFPNSGIAFDDAVSILRYRYNSAYRVGTTPLPFPAVSNVLSVNQMFGAIGITAFNSDGIDGYTAAAVPMVGVFPPPGDPDRFVDRGFPWAGADNPTHFFSVQELFDRTKTYNPNNTTLPCLADRLLWAGTNVDTYDRTTFFRLLSQLGTDSAPEPLTPQGTKRMNLNYDNLDPTINPSTGTASVSATNFVSWQPTNFFYNAANRLLANAGYTFTITNIQIYPTNFYTPSVHQLLQLAANMYDASTNRIIGSISNGYPTVFRPFFLVGPTTRGGTNTIFINGYTELNDPGSMGKMMTDSQAGTIIDLNYIQNVRAVRPNSLIAGIPLIVGAKKGWPSFNEFGLQSAIQVTRNLEFHRAVAGGPVTQTNQMYQLSISNQFGLDAWNSYSNIFPNTLQIYAWAETVTRLTNEIGSDVLGIPNYVAPIGSWMLYNTNYTILPSTWRGFGRYNDGRAQFSFQAPVTNYVYMPVTNMTYRQSSQSFVPLQGSYERPSGFHVPRWWLSVNTRVRLLLFDRVANRIIDYVNLATVQPPYDITTSLTAGGTSNNVTQAGSMWITNHVVAGSDATPTAGILNQINVGLGNPQNTWTARSPQNLLACDGFRAQFPPLVMYPVPGYGTPAIAQSNTFTCPFPASRTLYVTTTWQVNDPLVHYTISDLTDPTSVTNNLPRASQRIMDLPNPTVSLPQFGRQVSDRYRPWTNSVSKLNLHTFDLTLKDPGVTRSDDWAFPTNKYPTPGWLGRVHRGTPWQTVYLKSSVPDPAAWANWTGNTMLVTNFGQISTSLLQLFTNGLPVSPFAIGSDAFFSRPTNDFRLEDLFTTALDDNATRGQLSVNQTNLAAWSAVLSGVIVLPDLTNPPVVIQPIGAYSLNAGATNPPLFQIVNAINRARTTPIIFTNIQVNPANGQVSVTLITNQPPVNGVFARLGDILLVPQLTVASPYLSTNTGAINDAVYERIPQQIMGLLKCDHTPRFVIYCYGQALKPANHSIVTRAPFAGLCTNYQVTAETATRAVVRVDGAPANPHVVLENFNVLPPD